MELGNILNLCVLDWRNPNVYELRDLADEVSINGIFYEQELTEIKKNLEEEQFIVDRVINSRRQRAKKQISWRDYLSKFDIWIPA